MPYETQRAQFVHELAQAGISDERVLAAIAATPRHLFLDDTFRPRAYEDSPLPIACGQTISQPSVVAYMTQMLEIRPRHKVLEIGTGSGYQAAILGRLARRVYTLERHTGLARKAAALLRELDLSNVNVIPGDGTRGLATQAPFDRILLTAAAEDPPAALLEQLKTGGIMILPVGQSDTVQNLIKVLKTEESFEYTELGEVRFVPLLEGLAKGPMD